MKTQTNSIIVSTMASEAISTLYDLRWMIVFIFVLIASDFWFGISETRLKKEEFRLSRAGRRTCNKLIDYITYLIFGTILGLAIFEPLDIASHTTTAATGLALGCIWEIDSIVNHILTIHGHGSMSLIRIALHILKNKNRNLGEAIEEEISNTSSQKSSTKEKEDSKQE